MFKLKVLEINALLVIEYAGRFTDDLKKAVETSLISHSIFNSSIIFSSYTRLIDF